MFTTILQELMTERSMTIQQLVNATGITDGAINGWFRKGTLPTTEKLCKLADYFEVSTDYLIGRSNDIGIIEVKQELPTATKHLVAVFDALNDIGKGALLGYAQSLLDNRLYVN